MPSSLLVDAKRHAARVGLNLFGVVDAARFDACQPKDQRITSRWPKCGTVIVLGSGGREFWQRFAETCAKAARTTALPAPQQFAGQCVKEIAAHFAASRLRACVVEPDHRSVSFSRLAEAAGFGTVSPVSGLLLHPEFGPWVTLRAALMFEGRPFGVVGDASITDRFQPCCTCRRPCRQPGPGAAVSPMSTVEAGPAAACCDDPGQPRTCQSDCNGRCACPIGSEHRDGIGEEPPAAARAATPVRWFRLRVMQFVPRFFRTDSK